MKGPQQQAQAQKPIGRRQRQPYPTVYVDAGKSFEQAMSEAAAAYGAEQARIISAYAQTPEPIPPQPPVTSVPLPPGYRDPFFEDDFSGPALDLSLWTPTVGDPKWGIWPGGLPANWQEPDKSLTGMGPWSSNWEYFSPDQVKTGAGCQLIAVRDGTFSGRGYEYKSGIIRSKILLEDGLGRVIVKMAKGSGNWSGVWFLNDQGTDFEPDFVETGFIPFAEGADQASSAASTLHDGGQNQVRYNAGDMTSEYRTWDCEYVPGHVTWWLDGVQRHHVQTSVRCKVCLMVNNSVASPLAADWHSQVDTSTPDPMITTVKLVQMFKRI